MSGGFAKTKGTDMASNATIMTRIEKNFFIRPPKGSIVKLILVK
jgi:hypothetical protein